MLSHDLVNTHSQVSKQVPSLAMYIVLHFSTFFFQLTCWIPVISIYIWCESWSTGFWKGSWPESRGCIRVLNGKRLMIKAGKLTLNAPIPTKVVCYSPLLKCLSSLYGKQCGPRSNCSYRSSLFWVHAVCFYTLFVSNLRQFFAADDFSRWHL